jgi:hypothetical protein
VRFLRTVVWFAGTLSAAIVGYGLSLYLVPHPDIRGGFLFASPMIALAFSSHVAPWRKLLRDSERLSAAPEKIRQRVAAAAQKLGLDEPEVGLETKRDQLREHPVSFWGDQLLVYLPEWNRLRESEQEFVLVRRMLSHLYEKRLRNRPIQWLLATGGSVVACINLWLIIPLHAICLTTLVWNAHRYAIRRTHSLDVDTVRATGNLDSAIRYIERHSGRYEAVDTEERVRHLRQVFG